jgi:hypothetical protein
MTRTPPAWDVEGPVQVEILGVWLDHGRLEVTGPDGAAPWIIELGETEHPVEVVDRIVRDVIGTPQSPLTPVPRPERPTAQLAGAWMTTGWPTAEKVCSTSPAARTTFPFASGIIVSKR